MLHVDGLVKGIVEASGDVSIGRSGRVEGDIAAHHMVVSGYASGTIRCERLEVVESATVLCDVTSEQFIVEPGATFVGENRRAAGGERQAAEPAVGEQQDGAGGVSEARGADEGAGPTCASSEFVSPVRSDLNPELGGEAEVRPVDESATPAGSESAATRNQRL